MYYSKRAFPSNFNTSEPGADWGWFCADRKQFGRAAGDCRRPAAGGSVRVVLASTGRIQPADAGGLVTAAAERARETHREGTQQSPIGERLSVPRLWRAKHLSVAGRWSEETGDDGGHRQGASESETTYVCRSIFVHSRVHRALVAVVRSRRRENRESGERGDEKTMPESNDCLEAVDPEALLVSRKRSF